MKPPRLISAVFWSIVCGLAVGIFAYSELDVRPKPAFFIGVFAAIGWAIFSGSVMLSMIELERLNRIDEAILTIANHTGVALNPLHYGSAPYDATQYVKSTDKVKQTFVEFEYQFPSKTLWVNVVTVALAVAIVYFWW